MKPDIEDACKFKTYQKIPFFLNFGEQFFNKVFYSC